MTIRCKFRLTEIHADCYGSGKHFVFKPHYDDKIPEDRRFQEASPSGEFKIYVTNPVVLAEWKLGEYYYFDAIPVASELATA